MRHHCHRRVAPAAAAATAVAAAIGLAGCGLFDGREPVPDAAPRDPVSATALPDLTPPSAAAPTPSSPPSSPQSSPQSSAQTSPPSPSSPPASAPSAAPTPAPAPQETQAGPAVISAGDAPCNGSAVYKLTFDASWSAATHPRDFPSNAHFSPPVAITHAEGAHIWAYGEPASPGIERMAETGGTMQLKNEFEALAAAGTADRMVVGRTLSSPGVSELEIIVSPDYPYLTYVTMLAPSPDWFVGVTNVDLCGYDGWLDEVGASLFPIDAGTDDGASYTAADIDADPKGPIERLGDLAGMREYGLLAYGTLTIKLVPTTAQ